MLGQAPPSVDAPRRDRRSACRPYMYSGACTAGSTDRCEAAGALHPARTGITSGARPSLCRSTAEGAAWPVAPGNGPDRRAARTGPCCWRSARATWCRTPARTRGSTPSRLQIPFLQARAGDVLRSAAVCVGNVGLRSRSRKGSGLALSAGPAEVRRERADDLQFGHETTSSRPRSANPRTAQPSKEWEAVDPEGLYRAGDRPRRVSMCGYAPTVAVLVACRELGCNGGKASPLRQFPATSRRLLSVVGYAGLPY